MASPQRPDFVWECPVDGPVDDPGAQMRVQVGRGGAGEQGRGPGCGTPRPSDTAAAPATARGLRPRRFETLSSPRPRRPWRGSGRRRLAGAPPRCAARRPAAPLPHRSPAAPPPHPCPPTPPPPPPPTRSTMAASSSRSTATPSEGRAASGRPARVPRWPRCAAAASRALPCSPLPPRSRPPAGPLTPPRPRPPPRALPRTVALPEDAFTDHAAAEYKRHRLTVTIPCRDPNGPAMVRRAAASTQSSAPCALAPRPCSSLHPSQQVSAHIPAPSPPNLGPPSHTLTPPHPQLEKRMFDPDKRPRDVAVALLHGGAAFKKMCARRGPWGGRSLPAAGPCACACA
jgi:hypothetical protein